MTIRKTRDGDTLLLALEGRLDTTTAPQLQEALIPEFDQVKNICLDFEELIYVSSAGLRVILMGEKTAQKKGAEMTLINVSEEILEIFEMTGFSDILHIK